MASAHTAGEDISARFRGATVVVVLFFFFLLLLLFRLFLFFIFLRAVWRWRERRGSRKRSTPQLPPDRRESGTRVDWGRNEL